MNTTIDYQIRRVDHTGAMGGSITRFGVYEVTHDGRYFIGEKLLREHNTWGLAAEWMLAYEAMKAANYSDEEIDAALKKAGK